MTELDSSDVVRVRLDFSYDGTAFAGWAMQPGLHTIQGVFEGALALVVRTDQLMRMTVAGRTDAGVHARGQVAHVDIPRDAWNDIPGRSRQASAESLRERLNGVLPRDIVVTEVAVAPEGFDARFSAGGRLYTYRISDRLTTRDPLRRSHVLWHRRELDVDAMNQAAGTLVGLREFGAFCRPRPGATTVRDLREFRWDRPLDGPDAGLVVATLAADAFCHSMVRSLVGAVISVGEGRRDEDWLLSQASSPRRADGVKVALPHGLTLEQVNYPPAHEVARMAQATRRRRTLD